METSKILTAHILDILFEGRNKEYGAYDLRNTYDKRINSALGITAVIVMMVVGAAISKNAGSAINKPPGFIFETTKPPPENEKIIPPTPKDIKSEVIRKSKSSPPIIVIDKEVKELPIENEKLADVNIDTKTIDGKDETGLTPPIEIKGSQVLEAPKKVPEDDELPFIKVEIEARFNGNWNAYLQKEIEKNMDELIEAGESGTCIVKFVVSKDGSVSNVEAITMKGTKLAEVAVNAIRKGPKWIPAIQNANPVNAYRQQPVTFKINE